MAFKRLVLALCACAAFVIPLPGAAQTVESTPIPLPAKPDLSAMQFLVGTWSCSVKSSRRPAPYTQTSTYTISPDGWWIDETTVQNPIPWFPHKATTYDKISYDSTTKRWIDVTYGDFGAYGLGTSPGWTGDTITWHDPSFAPTADVKSQSDTTVTKQGATKMTTSSSFTEASGRSVSVAGTCTKSG